MDETRAWTRCDGRTGGAGGMARSAAADVPGRRRTARRPHAGARRQSHQANLDGDRPNPRQRAPDTRHSLQPSRCLENGGVESLEQKQSAARWMELAKTLGELARGGSAPAAIDPLRQLGRRGIHAHIVHGMGRRAVQGDAAAERGRLRATSTVRPRARAWPAAGVPALDRVITEVAQAVKDPAAHVRWRLPFASHRSRTRCPAARPATW